MSEQAQRPFETIVTKVGEQEVHIPVIAKSAFTAILTKYKENLSLTISLIEERDDYRKFMQSMADACYCGDPSCAAYTARGLLEKHQKADG